MKFSELADIYDRITQAGSDPKRVAILAEAFKKANARSLAAIAHFSLSELVSPVYSDRLSIGPATIREQIAQIAKKDPREIEAEVRKTGDMSAVAAKYVNGKDSLKVDQLWHLIHDAIEKERPRAKVVEEVFKTTTPAGAKYFTRMALNQMRISVGLGTIAKALSKAFDVSPASVEHLYAMTNDIGLVAQKAKKGGSAMEHTGLVPFHPYQFMNAHKIDEPDRIIPAAGKSKKKWILETKYDGVRLQVHIQKKPFEVRLFSRRLNDDTVAMPDVAAALKKTWTGGDAIVEGEAVAFDPTMKKRLPFQAVLQRSGRRSGIEQIIKEIPLVLFLFDITMDRGENLMDVPQSERRARLSKLFKPTMHVQLSDSLVTDKRAEMDAYFDAAVRSGQEGIMVKDPDGRYIPGRRTEQWMKLKPAFETLDVVIVGGIWGSGRRKGLLSSLVVAVRGSKGEYLTVGKVGTGFSEAVLKDLTARLEPKIITVSGHTVEIEPDTVIEVDFQDIQKTNRYSSGYALRIPRFKRERTDKSLKEADTLQRLKRLYDQSH
jgi:DNA ligase-1